LSSVGRPFLPFQWDVLLLEVGLISVLLAPGGLRPGVAATEPTALARFLMRAVVAKLYLESGFAKLQSKDPEWRRIRACASYYETAPLPTPMGWQAHQLPVWAHRGATLSVLVAECLVPLLCFGPARGRRVAFWALSALQGIIGLTGNYGYFNLLSFVLGVWLLDDDFLERALPLPADPSRNASWRRKLAELAFTLPLLAVNAVQLAQRYRPSLRVPPRADAWVSALAPFHVSGLYGLFASMTVTRPEVEIEGSQDGETWQPYVFRYKAGDPHRRPRFVAPHQPRLDWQMWFAALSWPPQWFVSLLLRLLEGSPHVVGLFEKNPFPDGPPRYVRAVLYDYRMTDRPTRRRTGSYWARTRRGLYLPALTRDPVEG
jgi:hypothetical protein